MAPQEWQAGGETAGLLSETTQEGLCLISHETRIPLGGEDAVPASSSQITRQRGGKPGPCTGTEDKGQDRVLCSC